MDFPSLLRRSIDHSRPERSLGQQVSVEIRRRSELMNILQDNDSREDVSS